MTATTTGLAALGVVDSCAAGAAIVARRNPRLLKEERPRRNEESPTGSKHHPPFAQTALTLRKRESAGIYQTPLMRMRRCIRGVWRAIVTLGRPPRPSILTHSQGQAVLRPPVRGSQRQQARTAWPVRLRLARPCCAFWQVRGVPAAGRKTEDPGPRRSNYCETKGLSARQGPGTGSEVRPRC